jgi:hypothetical protein
VILTPHWDSQAPAFISIVQNWAGLDLRTRSVAAARARIAKVLTCGDVPQLVATGITVIERASRDLIAQLFTGLTASTWSASSALRGAELEDVIARHGHRLGPVAARLWSAHGAPAQATMVRDADKQMRVQWHWESTSAHDAAWAELAATSAEMCSPTEAVVAVTSGWDFRLRLRSGALVDDPFPRSRFIATYGGTRAKAYFYFVLPEMPFTPELTQEHVHLTERMGVKIALSRFELCAPKRSGEGRAWRKLR